MSPTAPSRVGRARLVVCLAALLALALSLAVTARDPVAFQKVVALTQEPLPPFDPPRAIDIAPLVAAIPDRGPAGSNDTVYDVLPERRYEQTIVEGLGNCSNLVKGLTYVLMQRDQSFEVVYMMPVDTFLDGDGHTLLRTKVVLPEGARIGLVDVAAAAFPRTGSRLLDVTDLGSGAIPDFRFEQIRPESEDWARFYAGRFQAELEVGRISSVDTMRWYRFLTATYVDLGLPKKVVRMIYQGVGVVLGIYPPIHVQHLDRLQTRHRARFARMKAALWTFRIAPLLLAGCAASWLLERRSRLRAPSGPVRERSSARA